MALNDAELFALRQPLSNEARVLYCLGLRPDAVVSTASSSPLQYKALLALLNGDHPEATFNRGRQVNSLLRQLEQQGLVGLPAAYTYEQSLNGVAVLLPLIAAQQDAFAHLHHQHQPMQVNWQPDAALFAEMCSLLGVIDLDYTEDDIGEFVAYWLGRPASVFSHFQWTQKFAYSLKRKRLATGQVHTRKVGTQQVKVAPGIEADDNARKLVEKYATKKKP